jgi:hypothetical protein
MKTISIGDILYDFTLDKIYVVKGFGRDCLGQHATYCATNYTEFKSRKCRKYTSGFLFQRCINLGAI